MSATPMRIGDEHAADRLLRSQKLWLGSPYLGDETPPTPRQVGAVLHALADHALLMHLCSEDVLALAADRAEFGVQWQRAMAVGRFFQRMGGWLGA